MKEDNTGLACIGVSFVLGFLVIVVPVISIAVNAFVLMKLWAWFIVPLFGLSELALWEAAGVALVIALLTHQETSTTNSDENSLSNSIARLVSKVFVSPLIYLLFGWIVHIFAF